MRRAVRPVRAMAVFSAVALTALPAGCRRGAIHAPPAKAVAEADRSYPMKGVVRRVDVGSGAVTIRHDAIPGFMPAMTMPFTVEDRQSLDGVGVGDEVAATLRVRETGGEVSGYTLTGVVVVSPAATAGVSLNLSGGSPTASPIPKRLEPGELVPDFAMTTQEGNRLKLSDLRGKTVALTFIYTRCPLPDFCPLLDKKFAALADRVSAVPGRADKFRLLSVSFDPEHDTPEVLRKHAVMLGAKGPLWSFAVASHPELSKVAPALGLSYGPTANEIIHNLMTAVIGPDGRLVRLETGSAARAWTASDLFKTMYSQIPESNG